MVKKKEKKQELLQRITDLENHVRDLEHNLIHDSLTTLKNRAFFEEESSVYLKAISNIKTNKRREWFGFKNLSILFFDLDNFKKVNDTYGHATGDTVLREVSQVIAESMREGDIVARWGGEEILAMLLGANESDAKIKAEQIRKKVQKISFVSVPGLKITISVGVANTNEGVSRTELIARADKALYLAKESGRNKVVTFSEVAK